MEIHDIKSRGPRAVAFPWTQCITFIYDPGASISVTRSLSSYARHTIITMRRNTSNLDTLLGRGSFLISEVSRILRRGKVHNHVFWGRIKLSRVERGVVISGTQAV